MKENRPGRLGELLQSGIFWNIMGSGMMAANTVILTMLVGHFADLNAVGLFGLSLTTAQVLYSLALFGANDLQMTDYQHRYQFRHYFGVKAFSTVLAILACMLVIRVLGFAEAAKSFTVLLTGFMLVNSLAELYQSLFFQCYRIDLSGKALFFRFFLSTVAFLAALLSGRTILSACIWMLCVDIAATAWWILRYAKEYRDTGYMPEINGTMRLVREALPLCLSVLSSLLVINGPKYLINAWLSDEVQGVYNILFMPTYAISLLSQFIFKPYLYRYSQTLQGERTAFRKLLLFHTALIGACALCGGIGMWLLGTPLLRILFGQDLRAYRGLMFLFMLSGGVLALNQLLYYIMVILGRRKVVFLIFFMGMAVTLLTGSLCIPRISIRGAYVSFTAGQASLLAGYLIILYHDISGKRDRS